MTWIVVLVKWIHSSVAAIFPISALMLYVSVSYCPSALAANHGTPTVIAHPDVHQKHFSRSTLRFIFSMRMYRWPDGTPVRVFVLADKNPIHRQFCKKILSLFPYQLKDGWDRLVYAGTGQAPKVLDSVEDMHRAIAHTPGAVGYLPGSMIDDSVRALPTP